MAKERRRRTRAPVKLEVKLTLQNEEIPSQTANISLKGILLKVPRQLPSEQPCFVTLTLSPEIRAEIMGRIVRATSDEAAIDFIHMDADSFTHLKKIVELNSADPERITKEMRTPAF